MTPVMMPVLIAVVRWGDTNTKSENEGGFNPFFKYPICMNYSSMQLIRTLRHSHNIIEVEGKAIKQPATSNQQPANQLK